MEKHLELTDAEFANQFSLGTLTPSSFTHEAHLRLAWIHIKEHGLHLAKVNIQLQLKNFVANLGAQDKYHATLTVAAIEAVHHFMSHSKASSFLAFIEEFPPLKENFKDLINSHYSFDIFSSKEARKTYLEPDVIPF
ncbi:MAG: hypothetical protein AAGH79_10945 [Bacteroidota bacterium]